MSCTNALFLRYAVKISNSHYQYIPCKKFLNIKGLHTGKEGSILIREFNKILEIPDGIRTLAPLEMEMLVSGEEGLKIDEPFFDKWYDERRFRTRDITVYITNRMWKPLIAFDYFGVSFADYTTPEDLSMSTQIMILKMIFKPYEVKKRTPDIQKDAAVFLFPPR